MQFLLCFYARKRWTNACNFSCAFMPESVGLMLLTAGLLTCFGFPNAFPQNAVAQNVRTLSKLTAAGTVTELHGIPS